MKSPTQIRFGNPLRGTVSLVPSKSLDWQTGQILGLSQRHAWFLNEEVALSNKEVQVRRADMWLSTVGQGLVKINNHPRKAISEGSEDR